MVQGFKSPSERWKSGWLFGALLLSLCCVAATPNQSLPSATREGVSVDSRKSSEEKTKTAEETQIYRQLYAIATHLEYSDVLYPTNTHRSAEDWYDYQNNIYFVAQRRGNNQSPIYVATDADNQLKTDESAPMTAPRNAHLKKLLNLEVIDLCHIYKTNSSQFEKRIGRHPFLGACPPVLVKEAPEAFLKSRPGGDVKAAIEVSHAFVRDILLATPSILGLLSKQLHPPKTDGPPAESVLEEIREEDEWLARGPREITYEYFLMFSALRGPTSLDLLPMEDSEFRSEAFLSELAFKSLVSFVLAHELGHIAMGHHATSRISCDRFQANELEADAFATIITYDRFTTIEKKFVGEETGEAEMIASGMDMGAQAFFETVYTLAGFDGPQMGCKYPVPNDRLAASNKLMEYLKEDTWEKYRDDMIRRNSKQRTNQH